MGRGFGAQYLSPSELVVGSLVIDVPPEYSSAYKTKFSWVLRLRRCQRLRRFPVVHPVSLAESFLSVVFRKPHSCQLTYRDGLFPPPSPIQKTATDELCTTTKYIKASTSSKTRGRMEASRRGRKLIWLTIHGLHGSEWVREVSMIFYAILSTMIIVIVIAASLFLCDGGPR